MSLSIGIVGLPNVGKSTLFKALTKKAVDIANYPFCTIDPNVGVVAVPDERLAALAELSHSAKVIPTSIEFVDIAGLVAGAHKGEGLGNKFLSHIREVDAVCQVVRDFHDDNIIHVNGRVDPTSDQSTINLELILADMEVASKRLEACKSALKAGKDKQTLSQVALYEKVVKTLEGEKLLSGEDWTEEERLLLRECHFLTLKPMLYVLNVDEKAASTETEENVLRLCLKLEAELSELPDEEARAYLSELGIKQTGLDQLIVKSYEILNLITFFTTGEKETRAWTVRKGACAPEAAGKIHSDFEAGFIIAETIHWRDLLTASGWTQAREKGLIRTEGKEYTVQDGDVMVFRFHS